MYSGLHSVPVRHGGNIVGPYCSYMFDIYVITI